MSASRIALKRSLFFSFGSSSETRSRGGVTGVKGASRRSSWPETP
jgi:hypothetical protein